MTNQSNISSKRRGIAFWIRAWLPVLICIAIVACESTPYFGADRTSGPLRRTWEFLFGPVSDPVWDALHLAIRKTGHFIGYGIVGLAWLRAWWLTLPNSLFLLDALLALIGSGLVASGDEWHQAFLPNRGSSPIDVLLDCCGALSMQLFVYAFMRIFFPKKLRHSNRWRAKIRPPDFDGL